MHQTRNTGALYSCAHRFATLRKHCTPQSETADSTLYQRTVTGQCVDLTRSQAAEAASGDTESTVGGSWPAFGVDPVFLQGSNFYNPDMVPQAGELLYAQVCPCMGTLHQHTDWNMLAS